MVYKPKPKPVKRERRRAPREEILEYIVAVDGWAWSYSLSLNEERRRLRRWLRGRIRRYHATDHERAPKWALCRPTVRDGREGGRGEPPPYLPYVEPFSLLS